MVQEHMGGRMSKSELRRRPNRVQPEDETLHEPLIEDFVHVTASDVEDLSADTAAPEGSLSAPAEHEPSPQAPLLVPSPPPNDFWHNLLLICRKIVVVLCRSWVYVKDAFLCLLSSWSLMPPPAPRLSLVQQERLSKLQARLEAPYSADSPVHQEALRALWTEVFPHELFPADIKSQRWKDMGWQSDDPGRDFRGAGFMSLECLLYMAQREQRVFRQLMRKERGTRSEWEYPFAAAGVNLTYMISEVLDLRDSERLPATPAGRAFLPLLSDSDTAFEELFVACYLLLDDTWLEMKASYMDFPLVLKAVRQRLEGALCRAPPSLNALITRVQPLSTAGDG